jgi:hypothetical protein
VSRARRKIEFQGLYQRNMLGTFSVIRGFAPMRDLAAVSVAVPFQGLGLGDGAGYQRQLNEAHVEDIKRFLATGRYRFFPEVILSLRSKGGADPVVSYRKRRASQNDSAYIVRVDLKLLGEESEGRIRRIDGNHRLEAGTRLADERKPGATFTGFGTVPFCFLILDSDRREDDDLAEAMLFNLINSKALPIVSEHSLAVLMSDNGPAATRFSEDPDVYLTRWIRDRVRTWPQGFYEAMGPTPLSRLYQTARVMLRDDALKTLAIPQLEASCVQLFDPLYELAVKVREKHPDFATSAAFLPVAAEVYARHSIGAGEGESISREARLSLATLWLNDFGKWYDQLGGSDLPVPPDPLALWTIFKRSFDQRARSVFVAMSFGEEEALKSIGKAIDEAIRSHNRSHPNAPLAPVRVDKQKGPAFEISARVFEEIGQSRLMIADLTEERPNVYCEVGYAKSRGIPLILTFHKKRADEEVPWERTSGGNRVHFDLAPLRYVAYADAIDLRDRLVEELEGVFSAGDRPDAEHPERQA